MKWNLRSVNHLHDTWDVLFVGRRVGSVWWIVSLRHPELTKRRIIDGLNEVHGIAQPARTWSFGTEGSPGRWLLLHNGRTVGEVAWEHPPPCEPEVWQDRILAGLNWAPPSASIPPPEPAPPRQPAVPLRRAS